VTTEAPATTAIIFATDEAYMFFARGLVLSLADVGYPNADHKLVLIDLGCGPESLAWMKDHGAEIVPLDPGLIPQKIQAVITPAQRAMAMRPWLNDLLPQYQHLIWLDSDMWLQNGELFKHLRRSANIAPDAITVAPGWSHYSLNFYNDIKDTLNMQKGWYSFTCEPEIAEKLAKIVCYSGGVWGLRRSSPFWAHWRHEIEHTYPTVAIRFPKLIHLAEQIALNIAIFKTGLVVRLDPLYNFHCNDGGATRLADGRVVTNMMLPPHEIGVLHLANWKMVKEAYIEQRLLYRSGDYLTPTEWQQLGM
jgi:hypothetical protein